MTTRKNRFLILVSLLCGVGCTESPSSTADADGALVSHHRPIVLLNGTAVTAPNAFRYPTAVAIVGSRALVIDYYADSVFRVIDLPKGEEVGRFGQRGQTLRDLHRGPSSMQVANLRPPSVWVFDSELKRLATVRLVDSAGGVIGRLTDSLYIPGRQVTSPVWIDDSTFVAQGFFESARGGVFTRHGLRHHFGRPPPGADSIPAFVLQQAYRSLAVASPEQRRFALLTRHADILEIYDATGTLLRTAHRPFGFDPVIHQQLRDGRPNILYKGDTRYGYISATASRDRIVALFSGRLLGRSRQRAAFGRYLHVFTWDGELLNICELDEDAVAVALDQDGDQLYAVRGQSKALVRYEVAKQGCLYSGREVNERLFTVWAETNR